MINVKFSELTKQQKQMAIGIGVVVSVAMAVIIYKKVQSHIRFKILVAELNRKKTSATDATKVIEELSTEGIRIPQYVSNKIKIPLFAG